MKHKTLYGFKLNDIVLIKTESRIDKIVYIDDHVHGNFCMSKGGRYKREDIKLAINRLPTNPEDA
jgi:hypothetical protein